MSLDEVFSNVEEAASIGFGLGLHRIGEKHACAVTRLFHFQNWITSDLMRGRDRDFLTSSGAVLVITDEPCLGAAIADPQDQPWQDRIEVIDMPLGRWRKLRHAVFGQLFSKHWGSLSRVSLI